MSFIHDDFFSKVSLLRIFIMITRRPNLLLTTTAAIFRPKMLLRIVSLRTYEIWLEGDHYKWRAMRAAGVAEEFCTGDADPYDKYLAMGAYCPADPSQSPLSLDAFGA